MKTCETCKGTGQVAESPKKGDVIEITYDQNPQWCGLGVVNQVWTPDAGGGVSLVMLTGRFKGFTGSFTDKQVRNKIRHGHIHIDR